MGKIIVPMQFFGLGDVIWEQTLVRSLLNPFDKVLWPVEPQFVEGLNRAYPDFLFIDRNAINIDWENKTKHEFYGMQVLPLRWADNICNLPYTECMKSKYILYDMDWRIWKQKAMWRRNPCKENNLFHNILGLEDSEPYILVNKNFQSDNNGYVEFPIPEGIKVVQMSVMPNVSLFDWAKVIENATEIHTVSTSLIYILEMLKLKAKEVNLYPRKPQEHDFRNIEYILTSHNYIKHA